MCFFLFANYCILFNMEYLFISKFYALFLGQFFDNAEHKHHPIQLCMDFTGEMELSVNTKTIKGNTFLIAPDCPHKIKKGAGRLFLLFLDPDTYIGRNIRHKYIKQESFIKLDLPLITESLREPVTVEKVKLFVKKLFKELEVEEQKEMDERVTKIFDIIDKSKLKKVTIPDLAKQVFLSESRMQHLFKEEVGISIRKYLLWKRTGSAVSFLQKKPDLTYAAYEAGFSDSAHFSRTFKQMFGVRLKELFKNAAHIKVIFMES